MMLEKKQIIQFIEQGYVCIPGAFSSDIADQCLEILWRDTGCDRDDPQTWTKPVIRLGEYFDAPFREAANSPVLHEAFDQLVGKDCWFPRASLGSVPVRFPHEEPSGDTGWHIDASFPGQNPGNYLEWRINQFSDGRALLMLFLFSDIGPNDAPTRLATGSHLQIARVLSSYGKEGLAFLDLADRIQASMLVNQVAATGGKGTVYLCHPFIAHAAQQHRGKVPRFLAQPPLHPRNGILVPGGNLEKVDSPVVKAIRLALSEI